MLDIETMRQTKAIKTLERKMIGLINPYNHELRRFYMTATIVETMTPWTHSSSNHINIIFL